MFVNREVTPDTSVRRSDHRVFRGPLEAKLAHDHHAVNHRVNLDGAEIGAIEPSIAIKV